MVRWSSTKLDFAGAYDRLTRLGRTVTPQSLARAAARSQRVDSSDVDRARGFLDTRRAVMQRAETPVIDTVAAAPSPPDLANRAPAASDGPWEALTPDEAKRYLTELMTGADHAGAVIAKYFVPTQDKLSPLLAGCMAGALVYLGCSSLSLLLLPGSAAALFAAGPASAFALFLTHESILAARDKATVSRERADRGIRALLAETQPGYLTAARDGLQNHLDASGRRDRPYFTPADHARVRDLVNELDDNRPRDVAHTLIEQLATSSSNFERDRKGECSGKQIAYVLSEMPPSHRELCARVLLERFFQDGELSQRLRHASRNLHHVNALYCDLMAAAASGAALSGSSSQRSPALLPRSLRF